MIVKYGGNAMKSLDLRRAVARELAALRGETPVVVVHGGGPVIERELAARGLESEFVGGLRVTTPQAMDVVEMALGQLGKQLAQDLGAPFATIASGMTAGVLAQAARGEAGTRIVP